jgi:c-di-GMP-binding flagellar brake protein YcgR
LSAMQPGSEFMELPGLAIGQRLEIGYAPAAEADQPHEMDWLPSRLEDLDACGEQLTVAWPTDHDRRLIPVNPGDVLRVAVSTPRDAMYAARAVVEIASKNGVPLLSLKLDGPWQRTQRRNAVRVSVAVRPRIAARLVGNTEKPLRLGVTNISAGGVQLRSQDELRLGERLHLAFELMGMDQEIEVQACVRRVYRHERGASSVWDAGCEFEGMSGRLVERIVQFIFAQQRALARVRRRES